MAAVLEIQGGPSAQHYHVRSYHLPVRPVALMITGAGNGETLSIGNQVQRVMTESLSVDSSDGKVGATYSNGVVTFNVTAGTQSCLLYFMIDPASGSGP